MTIEIFSADCPLCRDAEELVRSLAGEEDEVRVVDLNDDAGVRRASQVGIRSIPAVVVDGRLAACCTGPAISEEALRAEGIGPSP